LSFGNLFMCNYELSCCEWSLPSLPTFLCKQMWVLLMAIKGKLGMKFVGIELCLYGAIWGLLRSNAFGKHCLRNVSTKLHLDSAIWNSRCNIVCYKNGHQSCTQEQGEDL